VRIWFGKEDDLEAWHTLCKAVGISEPPATIPECEVVCLVSRASVYIDSCCGSGMTDSSRRSAKPTSISSTLSSGVDVVVNLAP
jgi:hypothetical protein